jgi:RHS repeat-associated protein
MLRHKDTFPPGRTIPPGHSPIQGRNKAIKPKDARRVIENRKRQGNNFFSAQTVMSLAAGGNPIPPTYTNLAAALDNDVDKIFAYVRNNYSFLSTFGGQKGAYGCLIDKIGNSFDQTSLLIALLRAAGVTANFMFGEIKITAQQAGDWLGTDPANIWASRNLLANGSIPVDVSYDANTFTYYLHLSHCWAKVQIGSNWYMFDPSYKFHTAIAPIDLAAATGFNATTLQNAALSGATVTSDYFQNVNTANLKTQMNQMATNLRDWIKTNKPDATIDDMVGGRKIIADVTQHRDAMLPHQDPTDVPVEWTDIPASYKASLRVQYDNLIDHTFYSEDICGRRLTLFFNGNLELELRLDGTLIDTSPAQLPGSWNSVLFTVEHPYAYGWGDQSWYQQIWAGNNCLVAQNWGNTTSAMAEMHAKYLEDNTAAGGQPGAENVLGEALSVLWHVADAHGHIISRIAGGVNNCTTVFHHQVGLVGHGEAPFMDLGGVAWSTSANDNDYTKTQPTDLVVSMRGIGFESNSISQIPNVGGVSTNTVISQANAAGQKLYFGDSTNWSTNVRPNLVNYSTQVLDDIETWYINAGWKVLIHEDGNTAQNQYQGYGFYAISPYGGTVGLINGMLMGGGGDTAQTVAENSGNALANSSGANTLNAANALNAPQMDRVEVGKKSKLEVDFVVDKYTGAFVYRHVDVALGAQPAPYTLPFVRTFSNKKVSKVTQMGAGWTHNWNITCTRGNNGFMASIFGDGESLAANMAATYSMVRLINPNPQNATSFILSSLATTDVNKMLTSNSVTVTMGDTDYKFVLLTDGTYASPKGVRMSLAWVPQPNGPYAGYFVLQTWDNVLYTFNGGNKIQKIEYYKDPNTQVPAFTINFTYGGIDDRLLSVAHSLGQTLTFEYSTQQGLLYFMQRVKLNGTTVATYDIEPSTGKMLKFTDRSGVDSTYTYDAKNRMLGTVVKSATNPSSAQQEYSVTYDSFDRVTTRSAKIDSVNTLTTTVRYADNQVRAETPNQEPVTTIFNAEGKPIEIQVGGTTLTPGNTKTKYVYDGLGRVVEETTSGMGTTKYTYDNEHRVKTKELVGLGFIEQFTYDLTTAVPFDEWITHTDKRGKVWTRTIDPKSGRILTETDPTNKTTTYTYNTLRLPDTTTDPTNVVKSNTYNGIELLNTKLNNTLTTTFTYDPLTGTKLTEQNPRGNTTTYTYDLRNNVLTVTGPLNLLTTNTYDELDKVLTVSRPTSSGTQTTTFSSDWFGNVKLATDPLSNSSTKTWLNGTLLTQSVDEEGRVSDYTYDANGDLTHIYKSGVLEEQRTYNAIRQLTSVKDSNNNVTTFDYDAYGRLYKTTYPGGTYEERTFDANNNVVNLRNRAGQNTVYTYDDANRLLTKAPAGQATITYTYDNAGRMLTASTPVVSGDPSTGIYSKAYDTYGRLSSETNPQNQVISYQYDNNGNVTRITYPSGYYVTYEYDAHDRMTAIKLNGATTAAVSFTYDQSGRRLTKTYGNGNSVSYTYDLGNNLTSRGMTVSAGTVTWNYTYNKVHQMKTQSVSDTTYLWTPPSTGTVSYGAANNLNQYPTVGGVNYSYDTKGNLTGDGVWTYGYNTENMLTSAVKTGTNASFVYDPFMRQTQKTVGTTKTKYVYSGSRLMEEYNGANNTLLRRYVYAGENEPVLQIASNGTVTYLHHDHQGSVIAQANTSGVVGNKYKYSPFGEATSLTGTTIGYTGQRWDNETGMYHYKARYYRPTINRFLQPDPIGYTEDLHLYTYVMNDPMNKTDPEGLEPDYSIDGDFGIFGPGLGNLAHHESTLKWLERPHSHLENAEAALSIVPWGAISKVKGASSSANSFEGKLSNTESFISRGRRGGQPHRAEVSRMEQKIKAQHPDWIHEAGGSKRERAIITPSGRRYPDLTFKKPDGTTVAHQVGKANKNGTLVAREVRNGADLLNSRVKIEVSTSTY